MTPNWHIATLRMVATYSKGDVVLGILTGYIEHDNGFVLEHVLSLDHRILMRMLRAGVAEARLRRMSYIRFHIPSDFSLREALVKVGLRLGFQEYMKDVDGNIHFIRRLT